MDGGDDRKQSDSPSGLPPRPNTNTNTKNPPNFSLFLRPSLFNKPKLNRDGAVGEPACVCGCSAPGAAAGATAESGGCPTCGHEQTKADCDGNANLLVSSGADGLGNPGANTGFPGTSSLRIAPNGRPQGTGPSRDPCFPAMSVRLQGASNDPIGSLKRRFEECRSSSQSQSDGDDSGRFNRAATIRKDRGSSAHRLPETKRRGRINDKLRTLQELLPNCNKVDQAGVLDEAIEHLRTLQQQFLVLSTGSPMYMSPPPPPPVMLPAEIQQMYNALYPGQFPVASLPGGMSLGAGLQFPIPPGPRTAGLGLPQPLLCTLPFAHPTGSSPARSLSPDYSVPTNSADDLVDTSDDDLVDTSDGSESSSDAQS